MSFDPNKLSAPVLKRLVRDQRKALAEITGHRIPQHQAQEVVARMLGYATWHDAFTRAKAEVPSQASPSEIPALDDFWVRHNRPDEAIARIAEAMAQGDGPRITVYVESFEAGIRDIRNQKISGIGFIRDDQKTSDALLVANEPSSLPKKGPAVRMMQTAYYEAANIWEKAFQSWTKAACLDRTGVAMGMLLSLDPFSAEHLASAWIQKTPDDLAWDREAADQVKDQRVQELLGQAIRACNRSALVHLREAYPQALEDGVEAYFDQAINTYSHPWATPPTSIEDRWALVEDLLGRLNLPAESKPTRALYIQMVNVAIHLNHELTERLVRVGADVISVMDQLKKTTARQWGDKEVHKEVLNRVQWLESEWNKWTPDSETSETVVVRRRSARPR